MGVHNFSSSFTFLRLLRPSLRHILCPRCALVAMIIASSTAFGRGNGCTSYQTDTSDGVCFSEPEQILCVDSKVVFDDLIAAGLPKNSSQAISVGPQGHLWVGSFSSGLFKSTKPVSELASPGSLLSLRPPRIMNWSQRMWRVSCGRMASCCSQPIRAISCMMQVNGSRLCTCTKKTDWATLTFIPWLLMMTQFGSVVIEALVRFD